jgi:hypothetical protein
LFCFLLGAREQSVVTSYLYDWRKTEVISALTKETMHGCDPVLAQLREVKTSPLRRAAYVRMEAKLA